MSKPKPSEAFLAIHAIQAVLLLLSAVAWAAWLTWVHGEHSNIAAVAFGSQAVPWMATTAYGIWRYD